jgi:hypothetical protein
LPKPPPGINLVTVKRWQIIAIAAIGVAGATFVYMHHQSLGLPDLLRFSESRPGAASDQASGATHPARMTWRTIERPDESFRVDLPREPQDAEAPAYNEAGGTEPVRMLLSNLEGETTFAVTWQDNPPVARANNRLPERTLERARDGMLARTQTNLVSTTHFTLKGYPGLEITGRNAGGGILNARLIFAGERLYTLMALFPSEDARREQDVRRFFNSFVPSRPATIPETVPAASPSGT